MNMGFKEGGITFIIPPSVTKSIVKILLFLGISCSILSVFICRDLTHYLIILLLLSSFILILQANQKFIIPTGLVWVMAASLLYFSLAIIGQTGINFGITLLLYSTLVATLSIISYEIGLVNIVNRVFFIVLILILLEYIVLLLGGGSILLANLTCASTAVSEYRYLHNTTSQIIGIPHVLGLNSIFLGAQSASLFLVLSIFWFLRRARENASFRDYVLSIISIGLLVLSPTVTGAILFFIGCFLYSFLFYDNRNISYKFIGIVLSILIISLISIYYYIDAQHNFDFFFTDIILATFNQLPEFKLSQIIIGLGPGYSNYIDLTEITLIALLIMYGLIGFTTFLFLFLFLPLNFGLNFGRSDRKYILITILLFISLMHYNASIRGGLLIFYISILSIIFGKFVNRVDT